MKKRGLVENDFRLNHSASITQHAKAKCILQLTPVILFWKCMETVLVTTEQNIWKAEARVLLNTL